MLVRYVAVFRSHSRCLSAGRDALKQRMRCFPGGGLRRQPGPGPLYGDLRRATVTYKLRAVVERVTFEVQDDSLWLTTTATFYCAAAGRQEARATDLRMPRARLQESSPGLRFRKNHTTFAYFISAYSRTRLGGVPQPLSSEYISVSNNTIGDGHRQT